MRERTSAMHLWCCGATLLCFGAAKVATVLARAVGLLPPVPAWQLGEQRLMLAAGLVELVAVAAMAWFLSRKRASQVVAGLGACFLVYRYVVNPVHCPCMGAAPSLWPWLAGQEQFILLPVAYGLVLLGLWGWAREVRPGSAKQ